jgi:two-component system, chemotaxis family, chemotaxis protein CheY
MPFSTPKILFVVDDDADDAELLLECFRENGFQHTFFLFSSGSQMIREMNARQSLRDAPDCIIIDYSMPEMNGIETVKMLRRTAHFAATPMIMLSGEEIETTLDTDRATGPVHYLLKPYHPAGLRDVVLKIEAIIQEHLRGRFR